MNIIQKLEITLCLVWKKTNDLYLKYLTDTYIK